MRSFKSIRADIFNKMLSTHTSIEDDIKLFLKEFASSLKNVSMYVISAIGVVLPLKDKLLKNVLEKAQGLITEFNNCLHTATINWGEIADKWLAPVKLEESLYKETEKFKKEIDKIVDENQKVAKDLLSAIYFIRVNYDVTPEEDKKLELLTQKLVTISELSYEELIDAFITSIKSKKIFQI